MFPANNTTDASHSNKNRKNHCWICHQKALKNVNCQRCKRVFHDSCIENQNGLTYKCIQCKKTEDARKCCDINKDKLNCALKHLVRKLLQDDEYEELNKMLKCNTMGPFNLIDAKIDQRTYQTSEEFWSDILRIEHKCLIADSSNRTKRITREFIGYCKNERYDIDQCSECYELANQNDKKWFAIPCSKKHPLVWAKVFGYPYEPAKVMNVKNDLIFVYFFGDHKSAAVPAKYCFSFSKKHPNKSDWRIKASTLKEIDDYIQNLGVSFQYAAFGERFNLKLLDRRLPLISTPNSPEPVVDQRSDNLRIIIHNCDLGIPLISTPNSPEPVVDQRSDNLRIIINNYLDKKDEEVNTLKKEFQIQEAKLISEVTELKRQHDQQVKKLKRQHESDLQRVIKETKKKKWCNECYEAVADSPNFCNVSCGLRWHQKAAFEATLTDTSTD